MNPFYTALLEDRKRVKFECARTGRTLWAYPPTSATRARADRARIASLQDAGIQLPVDKDDQAAWLRSAVAIDYARNYGQVAYDKTIVAECVCFESDGQQVPIGLDAVEALETEILADYADCVAQAIDLIAPSVELMSADDFDAFREGLKKKDLQAIAAFLSTCDGRTLRSWLLTLAARRSNSETSNSSTPSSSPNTLEISSAASPTNAPSSASTAAWSLFTCQATDHPAGGFHQPSRQ